MILLRSSELRASIASCEGGFLSDMLSMFPRHNAHLLSNKLLAWQF